MQQKDPFQIVKASLALIEDFPSHVDFSASYKLLPQNEFVSVTFDGFIAARQADHKRLQTAYFKNKTLANLISNQLHKTVLWALDYGFCIEMPHAVGLGTEAYFMSVGEFGFRFSPFEVKRPVNDYMLPSHYTSADHQPVFKKKNASSTFGINKLQSTIEFLPKADFTKNKPEDVGKLKKIAAENKLYYTDCHILNQGLYKAPSWDEPRQVVVDPHAANETGFRRRYSY